MKQRKWRFPPKEHEEAYHVRSRCQIAVFSQTGRRAHDQKQVCQERVQQEGGANSQAWIFLSSSWGMRALSRLEGSDCINLMPAPDGKNDPHPDVGESTYGFGVTFSLGSFALIVVPSPRFTLRGRPRKLLQSIAQRFATSITSVCFSIRSTLKDDWGSAREGGKTGGVAIAVPIIPNFCEQARSETLSRTRKGTEDFLVFMREKKLFDYLIVLSDLFNQRQKLPEQNQHQAGFGAGRDRISVAA